MLDPARSVDDEIDELELLIQPGREEELKTFLLLLHPADVAELVDDASDKVASAILRHMDSEHAAQLISELDPSEQERVLALIRPENRGRIVGKMETDDVTDLLQELDEATAKELLASLSLQDRKSVSALLRYDPDTAGGIMQTELVSVPIGSTVGAAIEAVRQGAQNIDIISVFVVDDGGRYAGNLALQDLVLNGPDVPVEDVMEPKVVEVMPNVDQEEVARIFDRYSLVELGVVDHDKRLLGRITADDVHEVLVEEAEEDMLHVAGAGAEASVLYSSRLFEIAGKRLPWLLSTFVGGLLVTYILNAAGVVFHQVVILLTFVPIITGMSGNVGTQSAMIMITGLATGHITDETLPKQIGRDIVVSSIMAATCGLCVVGIIGLWQGIELGLCVGISLGCSMVTASVLGSTEPAILRRFGIDPTIAAGPLITSINDVSGVTIYTLIALVFLKYLTVTG
ncbi:MAG: magnesium transporter [Deltaproteobacteria bacterium]|nr:magnesium transporter [Deltaproteobacteria bacterium]